MFSQTMLSSTGSHEHSLLRRSGDSPPGNDCSDGCDLRTSGDSAAAHHYGSDPSAGLRISGDSAPGCSGCFMNSDRDPTPDGPTTSMEFALGVASSARDGVHLRWADASACELDPHGSDWLMPSHYLMGPHIGEGAYGSVRRMWDKSTGRMVAVKRTTEVVEDGTTRRRRVLQEAVVLAQLCHRNVVKLHCLPFMEGHGPADELYVVMECCDTDLQKVCMDEAGLTPMQTRKLAHGLLAGCAYLHGRGLIHRDLKPANCLVNADCTVKVCDFNLACSRGRTSEAWSNQAEGTRQAACKVPPCGFTKRVATRWYRPPEVLLQLPYCQPMDVWSAACIIAELLKACRAPTPKPSPLFNGGPCFPLSGEGLSEFSGDQLAAIFDVIGTPTVAQMSLVPVEVQIRLSLYKAREGSAGTGLAALLRPLPQDFETDDVIGLLGRMLQFTPSSRISAREALRHPFVAHGLEGATSLVKDTTLVASVEDLIDLSEEGLLDPPQLRRQLKSALSRFFPQP